MSIEDVTERLSAKLAALDLAEDEANLLVDLLCQSEHDVAGFKMAQPGTRVIEYQDGDDLIARSANLRSGDFGARKKGWIDVLSWD